jgi:O6-methylguanine-DNA--protein-cysteine methyltransferase
LAPPSSFYTIFMPADEFGASPYLSITRTTDGAYSKNIIALFTPCYRVVMKEGEDYGYALGVERKKWLLDF